MHQVMHKLYLFILYLYLYLCVRPQIFLYLPVLQTENSGISNILLELENNSLCTYFF